MLWLWLSSLLTTFLCLTGDWLCSWSAIQSKNANLLRSGLDSLTHGLVGGLSWWLALGVRTPHLSIFNPSRARHAVLCAALSSIIDLDHFITAKSFRLEDALSLPSRPPLHCTGLAFLCLIPLWMCSGLLQFPLLPWMWLIAFSSHHVRDATRRGLWLMPGVNTPPLPYLLYLTLTTALPYLVAWLMPAPIISLPFVA